MNHETYLFGPLPSEPVAGRQHLSRHEQIKIMVLSVVFVGDVGVAGDVVVAVAVAVAVGVPYKFRRTSMPKPASTEVFPPTRHRVFASSSVPAPSSVRTCSRSPEKVSASFFMNGIYELRSPRL